MVRFLRLVPLVVLTIGAATLLAAAVAQGDGTDPARNVPLPCEALSTPSLAPTGRSNHNIVHVANICGVVATDVEFQSRTDSTGRVRDYAFVGTMGAGFQIYDVTDPLDPREAGGYVDSGWQNDIQVRGNIAVSTFDGVAGEPSTASTCLQTNHPGANGQGIDIVKLIYNATTGNFTTQLLTCVPNPPGGAHNATIHPSGRFLAISNSSSDWAVDIIDLTQAGSVGVAGGKSLHRYRLIDQSRRNMAGRCPTSGVTFTCITMRRPPAPNLGSSTTNPACNPAPCP